MQRFQSIHLEPVVTLVPGAPGSVSCLAGASRRLRQEPFLRKLFLNFPLAFLEGAILATAGAFIGALIPGVPLTMMGEPTGIVLGMEVGALLFGSTAFLSGLMLSLPTRSR